MDKTLEETREAKAEVEQTVYRLLNTFETEYNISIRDVRVETLHAFGSKPRVAFVTLDVEI